MNSGEMDEQSLVLSIETYKSQLSQVEDALSAAGELENDDLVKLRSDLRELISLTEDSLLSFKKSNLLSLIDQQTSHGTPAASRNSPVDDATDFDVEMAAFQAAIADDADSPVTMATGNDGTSGRNPIDNDDTQTEDFSEVIGTKCRAPYELEWGGFQYHNCMIVGVDLNVQADNMEPKVRVMFCQPTQRSMRPCPFYLEDRCKFIDGTCRYCHGYLVEMIKLKEYLEPDYSELRIDTDCLAKDTDEIWYKAKVIEVIDEGDSYQVMYESTDGTATVDIPDIIPYGSEDSSSNGESGDEEPDSNQPISEEDSDLDDALPVYLWRPNQSTSCMGEWENHTKGIGSRLMSKMGYIAGQGLGRDGAGRTEPVPIQLLPQGKSLDKIMELKELAGDQDLYDVLKKQKRKQKKIEQKAAESYSKSKPKISVFDFINKRLGHKKGDLHDLTRNMNVRKSSDVKHISEKQLTERSDKQLSVQMLQTHDEITRTEKEISRLKESYARNKDREPKVAKQMQKKLSEMESHLSQLQSSQSTIQSHRQSRTDHKKLTIF